jgi:hypothetical protein
MPYSDETGWLSQQEWDNHATFCRSMGKAVPIAHKPGTPPPAPKKTSAAQKETQPMPEHIYVQATGKRILVTDEMKATRSVAAAWVGGLMNGSAQAAVHEMKPKTIVSYTVPHDEPQMVRFGKIIDADPDTARLQVQEWQPSESGDWQAVPSHHVLSFRDVEQTHSRFPDLEADRDDDDEAKVQAAFHEFFFKRRK